MLNDVDAKTQFKRAKASGWIPMFTSAGQPYGYSPQLLMAISSRETNALNIRGDFHSDGPHGFGLMQIDIGSYRDFCVSGQWKDVEASIRMGALVLHSKEVQLLHGQGVRLTVPHYPTFIGAPISGADLNRCTIAAYNAGLGAYYGFTAHQDPDRFTTGHNYSADVIARMQQFAALLTAG